VTLTTRTPMTTDNDTPSVPPHQTRYYHVPPERKTLEDVAGHGADHAAYRWAPQIDPRWSAEQVEAYRRAYSTGERPRGPE
jgi:hypothetical protein